MTDLYYKRYPQFTNFAKEISKLDLEDINDYQYNPRNYIYDRLRLPMRTFQGDKLETINNLIEEHLGIKEDFLFSVIASEGSSQIHTDTYYKKEARLQRYCNLAFPLSGNFDNRYTFWPSLNKKDSIEIFKNSYLSDDRLNYYLEEDNWLCSIQHKIFSPVLLNTSVAHAATGKGKTLFAYITIQGKTYEDCVALYDAKSSSATI